MQRLATLLALALSLPLLYSGSGLLVAGIASYQAEAFLQKWDDNGVEPDERAWPVALAAAQRAIDLYPTVNGVYQHQLGLIQQWKQFRQPFGAANASASRIAALEAFRAAAKAQPTWPDHWAALAYAKVYLLEFDAEFHTALHLAHEQGPWRININRRVSEIGLMAWSQLTATERTTIHEAFRRTVNHSPQETRNLLAIAERAGMTEVLCDSLSPELKTTRKICPLPAPEARPDRVSLNEGARSL